MMRRHMNKRQNRRNFKRGLKMKGRNFKTSMRGGYRI